jgi:hypothetical protein
VADATRFSDEEYVFRVSIWLCLRSLKENKSRKTNRAEDLSRDLPPKMEYQQKSVQHTDGVWISGDMREKREMAVGLGHRKKFLRLPRGRHFRR